MSDSASEESQATPAAAPPSSDASSSSCSSDSAAPAAAAQTPTSTAPSATPTLDNLLNKPSSAESTPAAPGSIGSGPPSNATVPFGSPQASPVPNGSSKPPPQPHPLQAPPPQQQQQQPQTDSYAATAAAVAAGAGSYPMPKNPAGGPMPPGPPPPPNSMYEQQPPPPHMQGPPPPHHVYYGQPPPHHPYWQQQQQQQQMVRYPGPPPQGSPYYPQPLPQGYPAYYPPPPPHHQGPPPPQVPPPMHMQPQHRPPSVPDYIKAQQQRDGAATPAAIGGQLVPQSTSGNSSVAGEDALEGAKSPSWAARGAPPPQPSTSAAGAPPGQNIPPQPAAATTPGKNVQSIVDKLTGPVNDQNPPRVMIDRRRFFESLVMFCEQNGDPITAPPQVSKQNIDLHRLYIAVRSKGGFMQVTKDKVWKNLCQQASSAITESSAAGYQLRKHYEKYLLKMECAETNRSYDEMIEFANKLKKKKKPAGDRESTGGGSGGGAASSETGGATTPATPSAQHTAPPSAASTPAPQGAPTAAPPLQQPPPQATPTPAPPRPGQAPPPPGYHPGPPPPGADPNAAYYYAPQQQAHGWPQGAPPQGYPPYGAPRMPPPHQSYEDQQRFYHQQMQAMAPQQQQQQPPIPQQQQQQQPPQPANTLQVDVAGGSQVNSRAPSAGPAAGTPDSTSQHSAPGEDAANRPQSRPAVAPTPPASIAQQPPPQGYYPGPPASTSYGSPRPPPPRTAYPMAADGASTSGAYPPGMYPPPGAHPQMWPQQQPRYPGQPQVPSQQQPMPPQGYGQQRRPPFTPYHMGQPGVAPGAPSPGSNAAAQMRGRYGAQPPQPGVPQAAVPQPHQAGVPNMMAQRGPNQGMPQGPTHHHAPATTAALMASNMGQPQSFFPPGCVESTQPLLRRRRKVLARELVGLTPKRVLMSMRSGMDTEVVWAVNALNVVLYDDTNPMAGAFSVAQQPEIINLVVEHLRATVSVLFPAVFNEESTAPSPTLPTIGDEDFWALSTDDNEELVTAMKQIVTARGTSDFNKVSRFGRGVHVEKKKAELPLELRRYRPAGFAPGESESQNENVPPTASSESKKAANITSNLSARVKESLVRSYTLERKMLKEPEIPVSINLKCESEPQKAEIEEKKEISEIDEPALRDIEPAEWNEHVFAKSTGMTSKFEALQKLVNRCLGLSNILRGYSFLPGNEIAMARHVGLLYVIGRFLKLRCDEISYATRRRQRAEAAYTKYDEAEEAEKQTNGSSIVSKYVDVEDDAAKIMDELANQLRDDAFVILCHLSVQLNLSNFDGDVAWPIYDGLIHWILSKSITAKDPLVTPSILTPRAYALEILCKMSVIEHNVDLLVSTGPWKRFESFLDRLSSWLVMSEEPHFREFSLVILNAICNVSDEAVYYTVLHTPALAHVVYFLEFTDTAMHSVVTQQGMMALRDNSELMGTSVGMLRRAATLLHSFCRVEECRKLFIKQQQRLLALSMSQLMDSRVAQIIVETLFEVQQAEAEENAAQSEAAKLLESSKKTEEEEPAESPSTTVATTEDNNSSAASSASPEHKNAEADSPKSEEKMTNGTPVSDDSTAQSDDVFRAPKTKKRPATPVVIENGSNGDYAKKRRRLENGTNGSKLNGVIENQSPSIEVDHTATTKNSMAAVA